MAKDAVKPVPEGMHTLTPHLICDGAAEAIAFYTKAFNAVELTRVPGPQGKLMHALLRIGDSPLMLMDEPPDREAQGRKPANGAVIIHLYVENVDKTVKQAAAAGAKVTMPAEDMFWGDRYAQLEDPFGHRWSVATHTRDLSDAEIRDAVAKMTG